MRRAAYALFMDVVSGSALKIYQSHARGMGFSTVHVELETPVTRICRKREAAAYKLEEVAVLSDTDRSENRRVVFFRSQGLGNEPECRGKFGIFQ